MRPTGLFSRGALANHSPEAARSLIGARLVRGSGPDARVGRIVEVEAYAGEADLASHARFGRTKRNAVMFGRPGVAYVYLVYGMHHCLNVVTESEGRAAAVLIRSVEPVTGVAALRAERLRRALERADRRGPVAAARARKSIAALPDGRLAAGPGLVCEAFSIDRADDGADLCDPASELRLEVDSSDEPMPAVAASRIGIEYALEPWLSVQWRFLVPGNPSLSSSRAGSVGSRG